MFNVIRNIIASLLVICAVGAAQNSTGLTANSTATIVTGISCTHGTNSDLAFGRIVSSVTNSGTVIVDPGSVRTVTGGPVLSGGTVSAAQFVINGQGNSAVAITLPSSSIIIRNGTLDEMTVDDFTSDGGNNPTLNGSGNKVVSVGATLHISAGQNSGSYSGVFTVTFSY
ncbi:MAG: DUF4402 domain-containing protein [Bacteroidota bacterium]